MGIRTSLPSNEFKKALLRGEAKLGYWLTLLSPTAAEIVAGSGIDWMILDMEHGGVDLADVERHIVATRSVGGAELVVRVPSLDPVLVKRLLDMGVRTLMYPMIETAEEARLAVAATRYPPHGIRGVAGFSRANGFAQYADYGSRYIDETCVIIQVESASAIAAIPEIGAVDGVDVIFVGPADLAASMGHYGKYGVKEVDDKIDEALELIKTTGKVAATVDFGPTVGQRIKDGYRCMAIGADGWTLAFRIGPEIEAVRAAEKAAK